jgi:anti-sigma-K factor RskA
MKYMRILMAGIAAIAIFIAGLVTGIYFFSRMSEDLPYLASVDTANSAHMALVSIRSNDIDRAIQQLESYLNSGLIGLHGYTELRNDDTRDMISRAISRFSDYRREYPHDYTHDEVELFIDRILEPGRKNKRPQPSLSL